MIVHLDSDEEKKSRPFLVNQIGENYFKTMGLQLLHGRDFIADHAGDSSHVVIDETATRDLGFTDPQAAIGEQLIFPDFPNGTSMKSLVSLKTSKLNLKEPAEGEVFFNHHFTFEAKFPQIISWSNFQRMTSAMHVTHNRKRVETTFFAELLLTTSFWTPILTHFTRKKDSLPKYLRFFP